MTELKRVAGKWTVLALTIGSVAGTGIFFGPAIAASYAGIYSLISWLILGVMAIYIGLCFGELIAMFPKAGGVYEFAKQSYGRFPSFIIAWVTWLVGNITTVVLIVAAIDYLLPSQSMILIKIAVSVIFILVLNSIALLGMQESSIAVITFSIITVLLLVFIVVVGMFHVDTSNLTINFSQITFPPIFLAIFFIAETFFGWEAASFIAEETKNPEKVIPRAILIATTLLAVLCILLAVVLIGMFGVDKLAISTTPINDFSDLLFGRIGKDVISIGIYLILIGSAAGNIITMPRLLLALARDKLFLQQFAKVHPKYFTPHKAIIFQTVVSLLILGVAFGKYKMLISLLVPLALFMYTSVILTLFVLRIKKPNIKRPFKAPFGKVGPLIVVGFFITLLLSWLFTEPSALTTLKFGGSLILIAIPLYFLIEIYNDPKMITSVNDILAYFTLWTERINLPNFVKKEILLLLGDIKGKSVLEFGCSVGTLTIALAKRVGPEGIVYATSFSRNHLKITRRRIEQQNWDSTKRIYGDVKLIHDLEHTTRVHPDISYVDSAVSVGMMGYIQDIEKVLKEVNSIMPPGGKICFMDYGDFFHIIPNVDWLAKNENIERVFRKCGFSVQVKRKKGIFWNYIFIYGIKSDIDVPYV